MEIKVLGPGCPRCKALEETTRKALQELGVEATITKVEDLNAIMAYPIIFTPALVVNEKVVLSGKVPTVEEVKELLKKEIEG